MPPTPGFGAVGDVMQFVTDRSVDACSDAERVKNFYNALILVNSLGGAVRT
jgi:hypothetical protein